MALSNRRPVVLMAILLALIGVYLSKDWWGLGGGFRPQEAAKPLPGNDSISGLRVQHQADGRWIADFDYFNVGGPIPRRVELRLLDSVAAASAPVSGGTVAGQVFLIPGAHHGQTEVVHWSQQAPQTTRAVLARMMVGNDVKAQQVVAQQIDWPDWQTANLMSEIRGKTNDEIVAIAVKKIDDDEEQSLADAKTLLERVLAADARQQQAYIELARVAMKSNWGPEGLHQAETLLDSALRVRPDDTNARILLGYVYAHQGRHADAQKLFADVAPTAPPNLWLWSNWGEDFLMQGKIQPAIDKYRQAVAHAPTHDTYDRARADAYDHLFVLLRRRGDFDGMEKLYKQRWAEYGAHGCEAAEYPRFMLLDRGDVESAITLSRQIVDAGCQSTDGARQVLGMAWYVRWAGAQGPAADDALNQARIYLPASATALYKLARSDRTLPAVRRLVASGERIDQQDNEKLDALAHALADKDAAAARRLLKLGASPMAVVGPEAIPVALLPVISEDIDSIRVMQAAGVDYATLRFRGVTALEVARRQGRSDLLRALDPKANQL
jgi:Tfp pilus assembly protein PilF